MSTVPLTAPRPHMVMLVGNHAVGDSRVEKSAISAVTAGYRVTIVGTRHRSTFQVGHYEHIPIFRMPLGFRRNVAFAKWNGLKPARTPDWSELAADDAPTKSVPRRTWDALRSRAIQAAEGPSMALRSARARAEAAVPGGWRTVWPQTVDYEEAFLEALIDLKPDIIHTHDRHPLPGAATYAAMERERGRHVPWVYDAHEWIPGQRVGGPVESKIAWVAAESQLIGQADAVLTVTEHLAERLQSRHRLTARPGTVINAPRTIRQPMDPAQRRPLREECGLGPDVPLLVYVGGLAEHRGVFTMVEALAELPEVHLAFVGSKNDAVRRQLADLAASLGASDRLHLFDYVPSGSVTWYIESATCGVSALVPLPGHDLAMPTKLREYAQAGLPVVASDVKTQAAFVTEHGLGTIFTASDASSLADALRRVLQDIDTYRAATRDPQFLATQTWEGTEQVLMDTWRSLCPATARPVDDVSESPATETAVRHPSMVLVGGPGTDPMAEAWSRHAGEAKTLRGARDGTDDPRPSLDDALQSWLEIDRCADVVLHRGRISAHGDVAGGANSELRSLQDRGKRVGVLADTELVDPRLLRRLFPDHAIHDWDEEVFGRFRRQVGRAAQPMLELRDAGVPIFTHNRLTAAVLEGIHWIPAPVPGTSLPAGPHDSKPPSPRVLIVPTTRSQAENAAIDRLVDEAPRAGIIVDRPRHSRFTPARAAQADIVVDALSLGDWTSSAAHAWSASRLVVGHVASTPFDGAMPAGPGLPTVPLVDATADDLVETVMGLARRGDDSRASELRQAGRDFAAIVHDGRMTVDRLRAVWDL